MKDNDISLGAKLAAWTQGAMIGVPFALKTQGWLYGWDHPLAFDISWWIISAPVWATAPVFLAYAVGKEIEAEKQGGQQ